MIKKRKKSLGPMVSPQAIMWRPIKYFSDTINDDEDELDQFKFIGYTANNTPFDLRAYLGHPPETVTLYFPNDILQDDVIQEQIDIAIKALEIPKTALAWRRGQEIQYGELERQPKDRLLEPEARVLVLKILSTLVKHQGETGTIKDMVPQFYDFSPDDLAPSVTRKHEAIWRQIIGNVKVHFKGQNSIFSAGYAELIPGGMRLTTKGYDYLKSIGFSS